MALNRQKTRKPVEIMQIGAAKKSRVLGSFFPTKRHILFGGQKVTFLIKENKEFGAEIRKVRF
jgi:hypothetical protein